MHRLGRSHTLNNCSVPKNTITNTENDKAENLVSQTYEQRSAQCERDLKTQTGKALIALYPKEHKAWSNSKFRSKVLKNITGDSWSPELDPFPGFLKHVGPKPHPDDSLDRTDTECGYVIGNLRWASKQLQSENRGNVELFDVQGTPMNKHELAEFLGISYDALRQRLKRGATVEELVAHHVAAAQPNPKSLAATIEACPWIEEKEFDWEACFLAERIRLLAPADRGSRTAFFVAKCNEEWAHINAVGKAFYENHDPDVEMPPGLLRLHEYWKRLREYAWSLRAIVEQEIEPAPYSVDPTDDELDELDECLYSESITDEDIGRRD